MYAKKHPRHYKPNKECLKLAINNSISLDYHDGTPPTPPSTPVDVAEMSGTRHRGPNLKEVSSSINSVDSESSGQLSEIKRCFFRILGYRYRFYSVARKASTPDPDLDDVWCLLLFLQLTLILFSLGLGMFIGVAATDCLQSKQIIFNFPNTTDIVTGKRIYRSGAAVCESKPSLTG